MKIPETAKAGIAERLKAERESQNLTLAQVGSRAGCTLKSINEIERRGSYSARLLRDVAKSLGVTETWLRTGAGQKEFFGASESRAGNVSEVSPAPPLSHARAVPVVSWATAGQAKDYHDLADFIDETLVTDCRDPNCFALIVDGDSMEPKISAGDRVIVAPNTPPRNGNIVVARTRDHDVYLKLFHLCGNGKLVKLTSYNAAYPVVELPLSAFRFIYPVHSLQRKL